MIKLIAGICLLLTSGAMAINDPLKPDTVSLENIEVLPGQSGMMTLRVIADDTTFFNGKSWRGVGSFCVPMKYEKTILKVDSVRFTGAVAQWDEKFANARIDTGFVSLAGIYNIAGEENPALYSPERSEAIANIYFSIDKAAPRGLYAILLTRDPIQKEIFFGSIDGFNSWRPVFIPGKIKVK